MPTSSNVLGVIRPFGFGLSIFLNDGHSEGGIAPRAEGWGGLYGGSRNDGCETVGLKTLKMSMAKAYASIAAIGPLQNMMTAPNEGERGILTLLMQPTRPSQFLAFDGCSDLRHRSSILDMMQLNGAEYEG